MSTKAFGNLLLIEDNEEHACLVKIYLGQAGYNVTTALTSHEALRYIESSAPDLILLDVALPGEIDGWQILADLKAKPETASATVIMISAVWQEHAVQRAQESGAAGYMEKPFDLSELLNRVERALATHTA
jgi:DNA-binding response OmpR family regulator